MPRYLVGPDLSLQYSTEVTEHDFGSTICDLSYIYDTSPAMAMLSKSGRLAASSGPYNAETDVQLVSGNSWPADQPWPSSSTFYGHQSSLFLLSPTS